MKKRAPRVNSPTPEEILHTLAKEISPSVAVRGELRRGEQWQVDLNTPGPEGKTKEDLIAELRNAPGKNVEDGSWPYYNPSKTQWAAHRATERVKQFVAGWRAGKSKWLAAELLFYMFKRDSRLWLVGRDYQLAREEFLYIEQWLRWLDVPLRVSKPQEGRWQIWTDWGAHLQTMSAADVTKLEAARIDAAGVSEAGGIEWEVINRCFGRTIETNGPVLLAGSLEETQAWYIERLNNHLNGGNLWRSFQCPSWENLEVFPGGREDKKIKEQEILQTPDDFLRKVACVIIKAKEIVFSEFDVKRHVLPIEFRQTKIKMASIQQAYSPFDIPLFYPESEIDQLTFKETKWYLPDPSVVHLAIDPGVRYAYAVLAIVKYDDKCWVIDEVYLDDKGAVEVIAECRQREWWPMVRNGTHVIDIAGHQRESTSGKTNIEIWYAETGLHLQSERVLVQDGIQRLRTIIIDPATRKPRIWVHPRCVNLINEFNKHRYRRQYEGRPTKEEPIDADNHALKALTYWSVRHFGWANGRGKVRSERYITMQPATPLEADHVDSRYPIADGWQDDYGFDWSRIREK